MKPQESGQPSKKEGAMPGEWPIPATRPLPMAAFALTLNILGAFLDLSPDALIIADQAGTIVLVNTQVETLFGYDKDELIGQIVAFLLPEQLRAACSAQWTRSLQAGHSRPRGIGHNLVGQRKDGSQFPLDMNLQPILIEHMLHGMGAIRDMTAQRLFERERMQMIQRLCQQDKLISLAHDAILVRDPESRILSWNQGAEQLYGWTAQEAMGKVIHTLLQTRFPVSLEAVEHTLEEHDQWEGELIHTCRDGRQVIVESRHVLTRDDQGTPTAILEINRPRDAQRVLSHQ